MNVRSLGFRTDLIFHRFSGEVVDRGEYLVVRTPSNPTYRWGNFLLFSRPPARGDAARWSGLFRAEIGAPPGTKHQVFAWDDPSGATGALEEFLADGFRVETTSVLVREDAKAAPATPPGVDVRPLVTEDDWRDVVELQVRCTPDSESEDDYRTFRQRKMSEYRRMHDAGLGFWYGAFLDGRMVADLGVFAEGGLGRYQHVETDPEFRRRGIARALVFEAGRQASRQLDIETLVICADPDYHAIELYRSLGFSERERMVGVEKRG